jgi:dolichol-phosphate mannosyltransferase
MIYFIIPAFNESANVPVLISSLKDWSDSRSEPIHLIAVDDGSTDGTGELFASYPDLPITLVRHATNRGVHEVFRSGFRAWSELPAGPKDMAVTLEADNTSSLEILDAMLARARDGYDVVLASCYAQGGEVVGTNLFRRILSFCANLILRCTPGMPRVRTFSSFYRIYSGSFLACSMECYGNRLIEESGFVCVAEMLLKFALLKARICEVPLRLDGSRRVGASKMKVLRTVRGYLALFTHAATGRLAKPMLRPGAEESVLHKAASGL